MHPGAPIRGAPVRRHGSPPDFHECSASPSGSNTRLASPDFPCDARRRLRGFENTNGAVVFSPTPFGAPARRSPSAQEPEGRREGSRRSPASTGMCCRATSQARGEKRGSFRAIRGRVSLVTFFARAKKVTLGRGRSIPDSNHAAGGRSTDTRCRGGSTPAISLSPCAKRTLD
jgi:hypothetical protein